MNTIGPPLNPNNFVRRKSLDYQIIRIITHNGNEKEYRLDRENDGLTKVNCILG